MFFIFKTSFKEKNVSLNRAALVGDMWVNVIATLLVYWRDVRSENVMFKSKELLQGHGLELGNVWEFDRELFHRQ